MLGHVLTTPSARPADFYGPLVAKEESILDVPAVVLANLCVALIMSSRNEEVGRAAPGTVGTGIDQLTPLAIRRPRS